MDQFKTHQEVVKHVEKLTESGRHRFLFESMNDRDVSVQCCFDVIGSLFHVFVVWGWDVQIANDSEDRSLSPQLNGKCPHRFGRGEGASWPHCARGHCSERIKTMVFLTAY